MFQQPIAPSSAQVWLWVVLTDQSHVEDASRARKTKGKPWGWNELDVGQKKKISQRAALDAEWWECHRIFLGSLIPSSESKEEMRNLGLQECECRRVYTGNNPRVVVEGSG